VQKNQNNIVVIAAGGTGGHIFPAQSLCEELQKRNFTPFLICDERTKRFLQEPLLSADRYQIISVKPSSSPLSKMLGLICLILSTLLICIKFLINRPKYVVGFGGYPSFPSILAALILRIPFFIHEQNSILGRVNRLFARFATKVFIT
jgi:UDP-N-acetylglucosamine--N-acetylmuramyl-(pentapeptide) pyrophosphoryl-undecaprenol N-acetylglucosamine transferase